VSGEPAPLLLPTDPLPAHDRVLVCGVTGIGKSTLCRAVSTRLHLPYTELDRLHWGPNWTPRAEFERDVAAIAARDRWVSELQYLGSGVGMRLAERAQLLLWLDYPRRIARTRLLRRTIARSIERREVWPGTGNVEPPLWRALTDEDHLLRWEARTHRKWRDAYIPRLRSELPDLRVMRFGHPRETARFVARL
jgi:adenylate kinase family enzyme